MADQLGKDINECTSLHHLILEMDVAAFRTPELTERLLEMQTLAEAIDMVMMEKLERDLLGGE